MTSFTEAAARAIDGAQVWARRLHARAVQTSHLLLALLDEEEGRPALLLGRAGLDAETARQRLAADAGDDPGGEVLPRDPAVERVLGAAGQLARSASADRTVSSEQLVLALLQNDAELRGQLVALGLDAGRLEQDLLAVQGPTLTLDEPLELGDPAAPFETARVLDADANRAREALRVVEDYCRFVLDDAFLSNECKQLRHDLTGVLTLVRDVDLLAARDTVHDVGTELTAPGEQTRQSAADVVQANLKRLQEALRSLEEFGKLYSAYLGERVGQLRYRAYTLERALLLNAPAWARLRGVRLCVLVSGAACAAALDWTIEEAVAGGAGMIQLREKQLSDRGLLERARQVRRWTRKLGVLYIINDRPDIARLAEADGVHLGQDDMPVQQARRILGAEALVGVSTHDLGQFRQAVRDGASYVGVGPAFASGTKPFGELAGLEYVRQVAQEGSTLPAFVIGGINARTVAEAVAAGARRLAVGQAVCQDDQPRAVAARLCRELPPAGP
jgi:thiamine-phosphate pyrophosphorylase